MVEISHKHLISVEFPHNDTFRPLTSVHDLLDVNLDLGTRLGNIANGYGNKREPSSVLSVVNKHLSNLCPNSFALFHSLACRGISHSM